MGTLTSVAGKVAIEYLERFPNTATLTLARMMYEDEPQVFRDIEHARSTLRYYRGTIGRKKRGSITIKDHLREPQAPGNPFGEIPEPIESMEDSQPVRVEYEKALIIGDVHIPYHDKQALEIALSKGIQAAAETCIVNGDLIDFYSISRWQTDPRKRNLARELEDTKTVLRIVSDSFKQVVFKIGNHEERWESYLFVKAPEIVGVEIFELENILGLDELGIAYYKRRQHLRMGHLSVLHGHEFGNSFYSPVNPARGLFLRSKAVSLCNHYHQTSEHSEPDMNGRMIATWSVGCLCHLRPEYRPYNKWSLGYALVTNEGDDNFSVQNKKIIKGKVY